MRPYSPKYFVGAEYFVGAIVADAAGAVAAVVVGVASAVAAGAAWHWM